jgi:hypothetical protein
MIRQKGKSLNITYTNFGNRKYAVLNFMHRSDNLYCEYLRHKRREEKYGHYIALFSIMLYKNKAG